MKQSETTLLNGRVVLKQSDNGLRASMDSVLLAAALKAGAGQNILDMGCGTGAVGLCALERLKDNDLHLTGIDIQEQMIDLARQNAQFNHRDKTDFIVGNIQDKSLFRAEQFDHILMNPPYYEEGERLSSPDPARETAYQSGALADWIGAALHWVKQGGSLCLIHRADRLGDILSLMQGKFGAIEIWPIYSKPSEPAIRIVIRAIRNRKTPMVIHPPIMMFDPDDAESLQSKSILRDGFLLS